VRQDRGQQLLRAQPVVAARRLDQSDGLGQRPALASEQAFDQRKVLRIHR